LLAQLKHDYIVPVYEAGVDGGRPYFVMECVRGGSLANHLRDMTAPGPKVIVPLIEKVARAVQHAHSQGILHRDLKPANILLNRAGGAGPQPLVSDFGLAKLLVDEAEAAPETVQESEPTPMSSAALTVPSRLTAPGFQPGTPPYMAPEQFDASLGAIGPATDVWALGVVLYELLTGERPFSGRSIRELSERVRRDRPARPRSPRGPVDPRLEAIVLRCLEKNPSMRFASAGQLADRLAAYARSTRRRSRATAAFAALLLAVVAISLGVREASPERRFARGQAHLVSRLALGEEVDLISPGGAMPQYLVRGSEIPPKARMTEDGLVVTTPGFSVLELLDNIPIPGYRIHAEFRHDPSQFPPVPDAGVGITFTGQHVPSTDGTQHVYGAVGLSDRAIESPPLRGRALLEMVWYHETRTDGRSPFRHSIGCPGQPYDVVYPCPPEKQGDWHTIEIEVTAEGSTAVLGDYPERTLGPLRHRNYLKFVDALRDNEEAINAVDLEPLDRPAVGVLVCGSKCTVRRLRIVPLPGVSGNR
jgi:hypothetical protein